MNRHPYLRAYMAGIAVPTAFLIVGLTVFCVARFVYQVPVPIERVIVFPMALIPNLWGAWNMLYVALPRRRAWTIGIHGALLPLILGPMGYVAATLLGVLNATQKGLVYFDAVHVSFAHVAILLPIGITVYYLAWKYLVASLNKVVEIAG